MNQLPSPGPDEVQLVLFAAFFPEADKDHHDQSRTLDLYDALPKFSLSWARSSQYGLR